MSSSSAAGGPAPISQGPAVPPVGIAGPAEQPPSMASSLYNRVSTWASNHAMELIIGGLALYLLIQVIGVVSAGYTQLYNIATHPWLFVGGIVAGAAAFGAYKVYQKVKELQQKRAQEADHPFSKCENGLLYVADKASSLADRVTSTDTWKNHKGKIILAIALPIFILCLWDPAKIGIGVATGSLASYPMTFCWGVGSALLATYLIQKAYDKYQESQQVLPAVDRAGVVNP